MVGAKVDRINISSADAVLELIVPSYLQPGTVSKRDSLHYQMKLTANRSLPEDRR